MQKTMAFAVAVLAGLSVFADGKLNEWEDPAVNSINRLPARTYAMPLADEAAALTDALEPETPFVKSLNGDWKIKWVGDPARRPTDFFTPGYDDSDWNTIDVPSCVEMRGYGEPGYTNVRYPHKDLSHPKEKDFVKLADGTVRTWTTAEQAKDQMFRMTDNDGKELDVRGILKDLPEPAPQVTDFMESVRERKTFALNECNGFRSSTMFNLGIVAWRLGRSFEFDPVTLHAKDDPAAERLLYQGMREPWAKEMYS